MAGVQQALTATNIRLVGLHCHIGSQIFDLEPFREAVRVMLQFAAEVRETTGWTIGELNLGGGLGIYYVPGDDPPSIEEFAAAVLGAVAETAAMLALPRPQITVEPGRSVAGPAGITLYTVGAVKELPGVRLYVMVDGGMNDNIRPALYRARYEAALANRMTEEPDAIVTVAGKCCESGDILIREVRLPRPFPGDILAVPATGAYNYTMSMNYNRLPRPAMVLVGDGRAEAIVVRESFADLIRNDRIPERLWK